MLGVGESFGRYTIEAILGEGGMGRVYRARDDRLQRPVALKVLRLDAQSDPSGSAGASARLLREARAAAALDHPNAVAVYDVGELDGTLYIAMELVSGRSLRAYVGDASVGWEQKLRWLVDVARVLAAAHARGLVHRDVKPENVMVRDDGVVKVLDFGIAKRVNVDLEPVEAHATAQTQTARGVIVGTPLYLSPEQCRGEAVGEAVDPRSDQFAWAVLAYELLTGDLPWAAEREGVPLLLAILTKDPPPMRARARDVPPFVEATIRKAMEKVPAHRFATMTQVVAALEPYLGASRRSLGDLAATPTLQATPSPILVPTPDPARVRVASSPRPRGRAVAIAVAIGAAVALAIAVGAIASGSRRTGADAPATSPRAPRPVTLADLPVPPSIAPDAAAAYRAALQAFRDGAFDAARQSLARAVTIDPSFAAAHLRAAILSELVASDELEAHRSFTKATQLRANLGERDAALLDALEPSFQRDPADVAERERRLEAAAARYPEDAEIAYLLGSTRFDRGALPGALAALDRAIALDPGFAQAWSTKGGCEAYMGRDREALASLDRAVALSPSCTEALWYRVLVEEQEGRCDAMERDAHTWIARDPEDYYAYQQLAKALFAEGKPLETVQAALEQKWARLDGDRRAKLEAEDRARLDLARGDFASAEARARALQALVASDPGEHAHGGPASMLVQIHRETGRDALARAVADEFLKRREAWAITSRVDDKAIAEDVQPQMLAALAHTGGLDAATFEARREAWAGAWRGRTADLFARHLWVWGWAAEAETADEATRALAARSRFEPLPPFTPQTLAAAHEGEVLRLAGRIDDALPRLERAAASCVALYDPIVHTRALLHLGEARAAQGMFDAACASYAAVLARWGAARPRSITAERARAEAKAIRCGEAP